MGQDKFSDRLLHWFDEHGRHDLPWQLDPSPYRVWVSEIMLQQTQVITVIPYFERFMRRFPDLQALAMAPLDEVLHHWSGLGYYARARNLHRTAKIIMQEYHGRFPEQAEQVEALPGIGRSTAGAILSLAFDQRHAILDGNVRRVLCRYHAIDRFPGEKKTETKLWNLAAQHTPDRRHRDYTQAIMDLGATLCTRSKPGCTRCPQQVDCKAHQQGCETQLPRPRPKRRRPQKYCHMLAMVDEQQRVALFQRPASGIWGGLYSLPEFGSQTECREQLANYRLDSEGLQQGEQIKHAFTHFDLFITPLMLSLTKSMVRRFTDRQNIGLSEYDMAVNLAKNTLYPLVAKQRREKVGIPTPVRTILEHLTDIT